MGRRQIFGTVDVRSVTGRLEHSRVGTMLCEADGGCTDVNLRLCGLLEIDRETCLGDGWIGAIDARDHARLRTEWHAMVAGDHDLTVALRVVRADGPLLWVIASGHRADGRRLENGCVVSFMDLYALRADQAPRSHGRARLDAIPDHLPAVVALCDLDGRVQDVE